MGSRGPTGSSLHAGESGGGTSTRFGTAVAAMLSGVAYGTSVDKDMRSLITRQMALRARVEADRVLRSRDRLADEGRRAGGERRQRLRPRRLQPIDAEVDRRPL